MASGAEGKTVGNVLFDSGDSFKHYMQSNLKRVVPVMIKEKVISKKLGKFIIKQNDSDVLLSDMKHNMSHKSFIGYLNILTNLASSEGTEGETRRFMRIMKGSLEAMKPDPELKTARDRFIATAFPDTTQTPTEPAQVQSQCSSETQVEGQTQELMAVTTEQTSTSEETTVMKSDLKQETVTEGATVVHLQHNLDSALTSAKLEQTLSEVQIKAKDPKTTAPIRPPEEGQIEDTIAKWFTNEGGMLYSSVHGVSVLIPPNAIPSNISRYYLAMHIYFGGPFTLADGVTSCSVVAWFHQSPYFEFSKDVTIKIPHAAKIKSTKVDDFNPLCILTWGEDKQGPTYSLSKEVPADFSDGYHAVFNVRHFSPYSTAEKQKSQNSKASILHGTESPAINKKTGGSNLKQFEKMDSGSLEKSFDEDIVTPVHRSGSTEHDRGSSSSRITRQEAMDFDSPSTSSTATKREESRSKISYSIARYMPADRSGPQWEASFAACYNHPTGNWVLQQYGKRKYLGGFDVRFQAVEISSESIEFVPSCWSDAGWDVSSLEAPEISKERILSVPHDSSKAAFKESTFHYPPNIVYSVCHESDHPESSLKCEIEVDGASTVRGNTPFFVLTSGSKREHVLFTSSYLYGEDSDIKAALNSPISDVVLDLTKPDHIKFLAEISFQLPNAKALSRALDLQDYKLESIQSECRNETHLVSFGLLATWVCQAKGRATLNFLKVALKKVGIRNIILRESDEDNLISAHLDAATFPDVPRVYRNALASPTEPCAEAKFLNNISTNLQSNWRSVGYLMGISPGALDRIFKEHPPPEPLHEQSYHMIYEWQRKNGRDAKYGTLFKAIKCMHDHQPILINAAYWYCIDHVRDHLQSN